MYRQLFNVFTMLIPQLLTRSAATPNNRANSSKASNDSYSPQEQNGIDTTEFLIFTNGFRLAMPHRLGCRSDGVR